MKDAVHLVMWVFIGALIVLVVTHASGFATSVSAVGGQVTNNAVLLAGGNPVIGGGVGMHGAKAATGLAGSATGG